MGHLENLEDILLNLPVMPENARNVLGNAIDERDALRARNETLAAIAEEWLRSALLLSHEQVALHDRTRVALDASPPVAPTEPTWTGGEIRKELAHEFGALFGPRSTDAAADRILARLAATRGGK